MTARRLFGPASLGTTAAKVCTAPSGGQTVVKRMRVSNPTGGSVNFTLSIGADAAGTRLYDAVAIPAGGGRDIWGPFTLAPAELLQAYGSSSGLVFEISGEGPGSQSYQTSFPLTENPLSEGGKWTAQGGLYIYPMASAGGLGYGTMPLGSRPESNHYLDAHAWLDPAFKAFSPNQRVYGELVNNVSDFNCSHECELWLRASTGTTTPRVYECNIGMSYTEIVAWRDDPNNPVVVTNFDFLSNGGSPGGNDSNPTTGDVYRASIVGDTISIHKSTSGWAAVIAGTASWTLVVSATDTAGAGGHARYATGQPGLSCYRGVNGCGGAQDDFAFTNWMAEEI